MTGLEKIINQITEDAQQEAGEILEAAKKQAWEIISAAKKEADTEAAALLEAAQADVKNVQDRAESTAQLNRRNEMLSFKQTLIREAIDEARAQLADAPDAEYFDTLLTLYKRFAQTGKAQLHLNQRDLARLPDDFEGKLKSAVPGSEVELSPTPAEIDSGFLLTYGGIDVNCSFSAIFEDADSELRDLAGHSLFPTA